MDKTIENKFFKAFAPNGVVSKCIEYLRAVHNLPETKDAKQDEAWQYYIEQTYPKEIIIDRKNFDSGVIGVRNNFNILIDFGNPLTRESSLIDEIEKNLNGCQTREEKERYLISLLTNFGEYGCDIAGIFTPTEQNDWTLYVRDQFRKMIGKGGNHVQEKTVEESLSFFHHVMDVFAKRLDSMLLQYGFDLLYLQKRTGIYLIENREKDYLGVCVGSDKLVQEYIDALHTEPQQGGNSHCKKNNLEPEFQQEHQEPTTSTIPTIKDTEKERNVFENALKKQYMTLNNGCYKWNLTKSLLAYMCGKLYCDDRIKEDDYNLEYKKGKAQMPAQEVKKLFGGVDVASNRYSIKAPPRNSWKVDELF